MVRKNHSTSFCSLRSILFLFLIAWPLLGQISPQSFASPSPQLHECMAEFLCPGTHTSSIRLERVGGNVMDVSEVKAVQQCLRVYRQQYETLLMEAYQSQCYVKPTVPASM